MVLPIHRGLGLTRRGQGCLGTALERTISSLGAVISAVGVQPGELSWYSSKLNKATVGQPRE